MGEAFVLDEKSVYDIQVIVKSLDVLQEYEKRHPTA